MINTLLGESVSTLRQFCHISSPLNNRAFMECPQIKKIVLKAFSFMTTINILCSTERGFTVQKHQCDS